MSGCRGNYVPLGFQSQPAATHTPVELLATVLVMDVLNTDGTIKQMTEGLRIGQGANPEAGLLLGLVAFHQVILLRQHMVATGAKTMIKTVNLTGIHIATVIMTDI